MISLKDNIDSKDLFGSTVYRTNGFPKCVYCHKEVENDYYEYEGEYVGQPYRCNCDSAKVELDAKEELYKIIKSLYNTIDHKKVNEETKRYVLDTIEEAYSEDNEYILGRMFE